MCGDLLEALPAPETLLKDNKNMFFVFFGVRGVRGSGSGPPCLPYRGLLGPVYVCTMPILGLCEQTFHLSASATFHFSTAQILPVSHRTWCASATLKDGRSGPQRGQTQGATPRGQALKGQ